MSATGAAVDLGPSGSRPHRLLKIFAWIAGIAIFVIVLQLLGFDIKGWFHNLWVQIKAIPPGYLIAALFFQSAQTLLTGFSYYGILNAA